VTGGIVSPCVVLSRKKLQRTSKGGKAQHFGTGVDNRLIAG
jgi:hypothetical protein